jgi:hypothetical protein
MLHPQQIETCIAANLLLFFWAVSWAGFAFPMSSCHVTLLATCAKGLELQKAHWSNRESISQLRFTSSTPFSASNMQETASVLCLDVLLTLERRVLHEKGRCLTFATKWGRFWFWMQLTLFCFLSFFFILKVERSLFEAQSGSNGTACL